MDLSMFLVTFREGLEAFLIIAIASTFLQQAQEFKLKQALYLGSIVAVILCVILSYILMQAGGMSHAWEAGLAAFAAILMVSCAWHMIKHGPRMKQIIISKLKNTQSKGSAYMGVFLFAILMIGREGLEAGVLLASLAQQQQMIHLFISGFLGLLAAGGLAIAITKYGKRFDLKTIFQFSTIFISLFAIQLIIYAIHEASEGAMLPLVDNNFWHEATEAWGPEGMIGQALSYSLFLIPAGWLLFSSLKNVGGSARQKA